MFLSFCFSSWKQHYSTSEIHTCWVYLHKPTIGESNQKIGKTQKYLSVWKSFSTSCKSIGGRKKKEKISESKTTTLTYFDNLKKKQQDQGSKSWVSLDEKGPSG